MSFITLAVADVAGTRAFYVDGLGWRPIYESDEVIMLPVAERVILSLWSVAGFTAEIGAAALGATVSEATRREWGGYSGYFSDPDGFRWEVAVDPGETGEFVLPTTR